MLTTRTVAATTCAILMLLAFFASTTAAAFSSSPSYRASVAEYASYGPHYRSPRTPAQATQILQQNLAGITALAQQASANHSQLLILPEVALVGLPQNNRADAAMVAMQLPSNAELQSAPQPYIPCDVRANTTQNADILIQLSCLAKEQNLMLVLGCIDLVMMTGASDPSSFYLYNTAIALDSSGALLGVYHKHTLTPPYEPTLFDAQVPAEPVIVNSTAIPGVSFALMICFDVMQAQPQLSYLQNEKQEFAPLHYILITAWTSSASYGGIGQLSQGWSQQHNVTLLTATTANIRSDTSGSGASIMQQGETLAFYVTDQLGNPTTLITADVPIIATPPLVLSQPPSTLSVYPRAPLQRVSFDWESSPSSFDYISSYGHICNLYWTITNSSYGGAESLGAWLVSGFDERFYMTNTAVCVLSACPTPPDGTCGNYWYTESQQVFQSFSMFLQLSETMLVHQESGRTYIEVRPEIMLAGNQLLSISEYEFTFDAVKGLITLESNANYKPTQIVSLTIAAYEYDALTM